MCQTTDETAAIRDYILYLKSEHSLHITLHPLRADPIIAATDLITFNLHDTPYCIFLKTCAEAYCHCIEKQKNVLEKCRGGAFVGTCHAGVREFIYPIRSGETCIGFISVSGYQDPNGCDYLDAISRKYFIPRQSLQETYDRLNPILPDRKTVDTLLIPLCRMLELAYLHSEERDAHEDLYRSLVRYLRRNHTQKLSVGEIGAHFSVSRSYISRIFKRKSGMGIHEYISRLRIADAETLLLHSDLSITEIAFAVGFSDSNYFSAVFTQESGMSPRAYRKSMRRRADECPPSRDF